MPLPLLEIYGLEILRETLNTTFTIITCILFQIHALNNSKNLPFIPLLNCGIILMTLNFNKIKKPSRLLLRTTYLAKYKYKYNIIILISNSETFYDQRAALPYNLSSLQLAVPCCVSGPSGSPPPPGTAPVPSSVSPIPYPLAGT